MAEYSLFQLAIEPRGATSMEGTAGPVRITKSAPLPTAETRANKVFPNPGGPYNKIPGIKAKTRVGRWDFVLGFGGPILR